MRPRRLLSAAWAIVRRLIYIVLALAGFVIMVFLLTVVVVEAEELSDRHPQTFFGATILIFALPFLVWLVNRDQAARSMIRHAAAEDWVTVDPRGREWPWTDLRLRGTIRVVRAWSFETGGFPVTAGEIRWSGNALSGAVPESDGKGIFVVVRLPAPVPSMAMRTPYQFVGDAPALQSAALRMAFVSGEVPAWTARDRSLFTVEATDGLIRPAAIAKAVRRALHIVALLDLAGGART